MKIKIIINRSVSAFVLPIINLAFIVAATTAIYFVSGGFTPALAEQAGSQLSSVSDDINDRDLDSDRDGLSDEYEIKVGTEPYLADTDGDGIKDGLEIGDNLEKPFDHDSDKRIDAVDPDDDNDGLPTILEVTAHTKLNTDLDTDNDGIKNYLDKDSDNDGVNDGLEAGMLNQDTNFDRIDDAFDAYQKGVEDKNGDGVADSIVMPDHNNDGIVDMLDKNYKFGEKKQTVALKHSGKNSSEHEKGEAKEKTEDGKHEGEQAVPKRNTVIEKEKLVAKPLSKMLSRQSDKKINSSGANTKAKKVKLTRYTDSDNDGLLDSQEKILGTNPNKRDSDGDKVSDAIEIGINPDSPQDSDLDGIIDALDPDDDNDGVLTKNEDYNQDSSPINDDIDDDGVPNYLDANDDGDDRLTIEEGSMADSDNDGILDYLDKNDGVKDKITQIARKNILPATPEIVVLNERSQDEFDSMPFGVVVDEAAEKDAVESMPDNLEAKLVNTRHDRVTDALEQAIKTSQKRKVQETGSSANPSEGKLAKKKQVPLRKTESGFIPWLTSLLPD